MWLMKASYNGSLYPYSDHTGLSPMLESAKWFFVNSCQGSTVYHLQIHISYFLSLTWGINHTLSAYIHVEMPSEGAYSEKAPCRVLLMNVSANLYKWQYDPKGLKMCLIIINSTFNLAILLHCYSLQKSIMCLSAA